MRNWAQLGWTLFVLAATFGRAAGAAEGGKVFTADDFARERVPRCAPNFKRTRMLVQIHAKLPPFQFTLIPEPEATAKGTIRHVGRIEIAREGKPIQTIEVQSNWDDSVCRLFDALDVNLDGYLDISVVREGSATWASRDYYLFDPQSGRFVTSALTGDLDQLRTNGLILAWNKREIEAVVLVSRCGGTNIYRIEHGRLLQVQKDEVAVDADGTRCIERIQERANGKWKIARTRITKLPKTS